MTCSLSCLTCQRTQTFLLKKGKYFIKKCLKDMVQCLSLNIFCKEGVMLVYLVELLIVAFLFGSGLVVGNILTVFFISFYCANTHKVVPDNRTDKLFEV